MTTTEDLYQQAYQVMTALWDEKGWRAGVAAVVDLVLAARPELNLAATDADASNPEHLRFVNRVLRRFSPNHLAVDRIYIDRIIGAIAQAADRLEAEHRAAQEKAAAEAEREKLIEQAARIQWDFDRTDPWAYACEANRIPYLTGARALVDAGWRPAPTTDGGAA